jgi:hypothetical protein
MIYEKFIESSTFYECKQSKQGKKNYNYHYTKFYRVLLQTHLFLFLSDHRSQLDSYIVTLNLFNYFPFFLLGLFVGPFLAFFAILYSSPHDFTVKMPTNNENKYIKEVWAENLEEEMAILRDRVEQYPFLAMVQGFF